MPRPSSAFLSGMGMGPVGGPPKRPSPRPSPPPTLKRPGAAPNAPRPNGRSVSKGASGAPRPFEASSSRGPSKEPAPSPEEQAKDALEAAAALHKAWSFHHAL